LIILQPDRLHQADTQITNEIIFQEFLTMDSNSKEERFLNNASKDPAISHYAFPESLLGKSGPFWGS